MSTELKESHLIYKSAYLELYEDLLRIGGRNRTEEEEENQEISDEQVKSEKEEASNKNNTIKIFQRIKTTHDSVVIIPILPDGSFLMIEIYRYGIDKVLLEFPGGIIEENEAEPIKTARKELLEETGYNSKVLEYKGWFYTWPSKMNKKIHVFLAKELEKVSEQDLEETENIKVKQISKQELIARFKNQEIKTAGAIAAFFYGYMIDAIYGGGSRDTFSTQGGEGNVHPS